MSGARHWEQDKEATIYIGGIDERVTDSVIWELCLQVGRIVNVHLPKDRISQNHQTYGFVEFISEEDAEYAVRVLHQVRLYGKQLRVNMASADKQKTIEVGAELFIGNLDAMVDEKALYDTFSRFGPLVQPPKVARDESGLSKGYGFVSYSNFESSDTAIANMNGQYIMNKDISVQYAYKKDGKGERHGDEAERTLADQAKRNNVETHQMPMLPQFPAQNGAPQAPNRALYDGPAGKPPSAPPFPLPMQEGLAQRPYNAGYEYSGPPGSGPAYPPAQVPGFSSLAPPAPPPGFAPPGMQQQNPNMYQGYAPPPYPHPR